MSISPESDFGQYQIISAIGAGGMGEIYLARDTRLERHVALKILPEKFTADHDRLNRFVREAKSASALNHPNIITIYEIGKFDGTNFIAAEFVEGETVRDRLARGKILFDELFSIAVQTSEALAAAHAAGIIHRDIKPENIMIRRDGYVKVLDFGLAKLTEKQNPISDLEAETRKLTSTTPGMVLGTAAYMSPEQTRGLANIDARTDIWSFGVVLFEMLTGRVPFTGETASDVIASILKTDAPHLSKCIADCPQELERIVTKTLRKNREERYQVIKDLALDLKSLRKELEFSAEFERATDGTERNLTAEMPRQITTAVTGRRFSPLNILPILLVAALIFGGVWWFFGRNEKQPETPETAGLKTVEIVNWSSSPGEIYSVGSFSPDGKMIAFTSTKTGTKNIWIKQTTGSGEAIQITKDEFKNESPIWSPDGERLAFFSTRGKQMGFWQMPVFGGSPKLITTIEDGSSQLRFWSKKDLIYYESGGNISAADAASGQTKQITDLDSKVIDAQSISLSPDEQQITYTTVDGEIWSIWTRNLAADAAPKKLVSAAAEIKNIVWHPDNRRIFYSAAVDGIFQIFVTDSDAATPKQITSAERDCLVVDVSSDGNKILYGSAKEESDIWSVNLKDAKESAVASEINSELWANVSPDGKSIAYQSIKNLSQGNNIADGMILTKTLNSDEPPTELVAKGFLPVWSPDGRQIAFMQLTGDKYQIKTIKATGGDQKNLTTDGTATIDYSVQPYNRLQTSYVSWSPDSQKIAYISNQSGQHNIRLVNADGTNDTPLTSGDDKNLSRNCPLWSADGRRIAFTSKTNKGKPVYNVWVTDTETKNSDMVVQADSFLRLIGWSQSGNELVLASVTSSETDGLPKEVSLLQAEIETHKTRPIAALKDTYLYNIHLSPDKKTIAFAAHREGKDNLWLIPAAGGEAKMLTANNDSRLYFSSLAWSPASDSIFFGKQSRYSLLSMLTNFK